MPYAQRRKVPDRHQGIVDGSQGTGPSDRKLFLQTVPQRHHSGGQALPHRDQEISLRGKPVHDCRGMPCMFTITKASARQPFLAVSLELDKSLLARLAREIGLPMNSGSAQGVAV